MRRLAGVAVVAALMLGPSSHAATTVTVVVDVNAARHAIAPQVYGWNGEASLDQPGSVAGGFAQTLAASRPGLVRIGGNRFTAFNWETGYSNAGSDYLYENDDYLTSSSTPGAAVLGTVQAVKGIGGTTLVTVPISSYVAKDANGPVTHNGTVDTSRFLQNKATGPLTTHPSKTDGFVYQNQFVDWLAHAVPGAKVAYSLDNEPNDWYSTHEEVHPAHLTYAELTNDDLTFAKMIKATYASLGLAAPLVMGPVLDGWQGQEDPDNNDGSSADFAAHGRFVDYYLKAVHAAEQKAGKRLIDVLDLHWYPQVSPDVYNLDHGPDTVAAREQAPRSLWDPSYTEPSWVADYIGGPIRLIPRLKDEINAYDPGMRIGISEWNYGGGEDISGGIATADALGIFGAYNVKEAAFWPQFQPQEDWAFGAFALYRNYDGNGASFGDTSVSATDSDTVNTSAYAAVSSTNAKRATVVLVNKNLAATTVSLQLKHFTSTGHASVYTLTSADSSPQSADALTATGPNTFTYRMPAQSVSMIVPVAAQAAPVFYADAPPAAVNGLAYHYTFGATGTPTPTYSFASGTLPAGLTLASNGVLSGTPTTNSTATFKVRAKNSVGSVGTPVLSITTSTGDAPVFTADAPTDTVWEADYSYSFAASGNPAPAFSLASGLLPPGLTLDDTGALTGAATAVGSYTFAVTAANGVAPDATTATLTVNVAAPAAGTVLAWGDGSGGELSSGNRVSQTGPGPVPGVTAVQIAAGDEHALALTADGKVYAWGNDVCGEIGDGHDGSCGEDKPVHVPVQVAFPDGTPPIVAIAAGSKDSLALDQNGNVWGWGDDGVGELGDGTTGVTRDTPVEADLGAAAGHIVAIAADGYSTAALTDGGDVLTWGSGTQGALGNDGTDDSSTPVSVDLGAAAGTVTAIAAGGSQAGHVIALTTGKTLVGWGNNAQGQVGDGTTTDRTSAVPAGPSSVLAIATGGYQSFALTSDGKVWGWGNNGYGELGTGAASDHEATPVQAFAGRTVDQVSGGDFFTLALTDDGAVHGVGIDEQGQLGDGTTSDTPTPVDTLLPASTKAGAISAGAAFGLALVGTPAPLVARVTQYLGPLPGGNVLISGSGFTPSSRVRVGRVSVTPTFLSSSELLVSTTAHGVVRVTNGTRVSAITAGSRR